MGAQAQGKRYFPLDLQLSVLPQRKPQFVSTTGNENVKLDSESQHKLHTLYLFVAIYPHFPSVCEKPDERNAVSLLAPHAAQTRPLFKFSIVWLQDAVRAPNHTWINFVGLAEECSIALSSEKGNVKHMKHGDAVIIVWELWWVSVAMICAGGEGYFI